MEAEDESFRSAEIVARRESLRRYGLAHLLKEHYDWEITDAQGAPFPFGLRDLPAKIADNLATDTSGLGIDYNEESLSADVARVLMRNEAQLTFNHLNI